MDKWVTELRNEFPTATKSVYMDIAYDCGGGEFSKKAACRYFDDWHNAAANNERGGPGRLSHFLVMDELRKNLNQLIEGEGPVQIAFTKNTNEGMNAILQGFNFKPTDNVVTCGLEHASVIMPCLNLQKTRGIEVRIAKDIADGRMPIDELKSLCDENTKIMALSHVQSSTGDMIDLSELGPWCRERGIFLVIDAIQSLGIVPFKAKEWQIGAVTAAAYKGLLGLNCVAFTYYDPEFLKQIWPSYIAAGPYNTITRDGTYQLVCKDDTKARKMENSTVDALGSYVFHDSVQKIMDIGLDNITNHIFTLYDALYDGLEALGYKLVQKRKGLHANIIAFEADESVFTYLREKNICLSYNNAKFIRLSIAPYSTMDDINYVLDCLKQLSSPRF